MDFVSIFLNLSAIPSEVIASISINEDYSTNFNDELEKYLSRNPMKRFGSTSIYEWIKLYTQFLVKKDMEHYDLEAEKKVQSFKKQKEEEFR